MLIILVIVVVIVWIVRRFVTFTLQSLEWLESFYRGPINTKLSSIVDGLMTVRAYCKQQYFLEEFLRESDKVSWISLTFYGWQAFTVQILDIVGFLIALLNTILVIIFKLETEWFSLNSLAIAVTTSTNIYFYISYIPQNLLFFFLLSISFF